MVWGGIGVVVLVTMSSLRSTADGSTDARVNTAAFVDTFVLTRTFPDIPTSGNIINAVPSKLAFANGGSMWLGCGPRAEGHLADEAPHIFRPDPWLGCLRSAQRPVSPLVCWRNHIGTSALLGWSRSQSFVDW